MTDHETTQRIGAMEKKLDDLINAVDKLTTEVAETKEIVAAWKSVKLWAQFGKWIAGLVTSFAAAGAALKMWWLK